MTPTLKAAFWMTGAISSFSLLGVAGRELKGDLDTFEIMLYRSVVGFVLVLGAAVVLGRVRDLAPRRMGLQFTRNAIHYAGQNLWFYAVTVAPLAQVFALEFTMPIWALLLAVPVLGERLTPRRVIVALIGFVGILIVTEAWTFTLGPGVLHAALSAIGFAGAAVFTRRLTRDVPVIAILFWLSVMQGVFSLVIAGYDGVIAWPAGEAFWWALSIGIGGMVAHLCLTTALSLAPASVVIPIDFARLPLITVVGALLYSEPASVWVFAGAAVIFAANYMNLLAESRQR
jgi:drug/metabolite transporter (DMT)-like permease